MTKRKLTLAERAQRLIRRDDRRQVRAIKEADNRAYHQERMRQAEIQRNKQIKEREEGRKKRVTKKTAAGRVPKAIRDVDALQRKKGITFVQTSTKTHNRVASKTGTPRNRPRPRTLPGAEQRRIERNRKAWTQQ